MSELGAKDAAEMSRAEALLMLARGGEGVPEKDRRMALVLLDGPQMDFTAEHRARAFRPKRLPIIVAVRGALRQIGEDWAREQEQALAEVDELAGLRHG